MKSTNRILVWLHSQKRALNFTYKELVKNPLTSIITVCIIAIGITLPLLFHVVLKNLNFLNQHWQSKSPTISLYLKTDLSENQVNGFIAELKTNNHIAEIKYISSKQALVEFKQNTQLGNIIDLFEKNPLPSVLIILPTLDYQSPTKISFLFNEIKNSPLIDSAMLDINWVKRLYALVKIGQRITNILTLFFAIGVLLIIGNALRTIVINHQEEVEIMKLMGATDSFIITPLLYCGVFYALLGSMLATCLTNFFIWMLQNPVLDFARTYQAQVNLEDLSFEDSTRIIFYSVVACLIGGYIITQRLLNQKNKQIN